MPYRTSDERMARDEGLQEGQKQELLNSLTLALEFRFGEKGKALARELAAVPDLNKLRELQTAVYRSTMTIDQLRPMVVQR